MCSRIFVGEQFGYDFMCGSKCHLSRSQLFAVLSQRSQLHSMCDALQCEQWCLRMRFSELFAMQYQRNFLRCLPCASVHQYHKPRLLTCALAETHMRSSQLPALPFRESMLALCSRIFSEHNNISMHIEQLYSPWFIKLFLMRLLWILVPRM